MTTDKPAGARPGAESAEVRKPSIHADLPSGGKCGKSAEKVRNHSLFTVPACHPAPMPAAAAGPGPAAGLPPYLVTARPCKMRREDGPRQPLTSGGSGPAVLLTCESAPEATAGTGRVLTHPAFDRPPVENERRPGPKAGAVSMAAARRRRLAEAMQAKRAAPQHQAPMPPPCDVLADAIQQNAGRPLTAWELHCARAELADAEGPPDAARERQTILAALAILEARMRRPGPAMDTLAVVRQFLALHMAPRDREAFGVMFLDTQHRLIQFEVLFTGTLTQVHAYPREVVRRALALNAAAVVLAHNHPSGRPEPSPADVHLTAAMQAALRLVDVRVVDHVVIGWPGAVSFAERGML